jgi:hypothetical protein
MNVNDLINRLRDGDNVGAEDAFHGLMADKINTAMDARKIEVAGTMATGEEQLELDFEEDESETEVAGDEDISTDQETD